MVFSFFVTALHSYFPPLPSHHTDY
ncbi:MAG: hypothetical protein K0S60_832, partial [Evtepia sp.]|nr:hypothetical protein [Evtepia sp.]